MMLAVLPRQSTDEVGGELFVAAYQRKLGHLPTAAINFLADKAMERCRWFPTIAECLEILEDWRRDDEHTRRKFQAHRIAQAEAHARSKDKYDWSSKSSTMMTQAQVDAMTPELHRIGLTCGALVRDETGKIVPARPIEGSDGF